MKRMIAFVIFLFFFGACATQSAVQIREPFDPVKHRAVQIHKCQDRSGYQGKHDLTGEATRTLREKVDASEFFEVKADGSLLLICEIEDFAEGSAVKRWLMPGWGATRSSVAVTVMETSGQKVLANLRSQSAVSAGGFFTVGADQYILGTAFDEILQKLEAWARKEEKQDAGH